MQNKIESQNHSIEQKKLALKGIYYMNLFTRDFKRLLWQR